MWFTIFGLLCQKHLMSSVYKLTYFTYCMGSIAAPSLSLKPHSEPMSLHPVIDTPIGLVSTVVQIQEMPSTSNDQTFNI